VFCHPCTFTYAYLAVDVRKNGFFTDDATAAAALVASDFCTLYAYMSPYVSTSATKNPKNPKNSAKKLKFAKNWTWNHDSQKKFEKIFHGKFSEIFFGQIFFGHLFYKIFP
jgi:hypothetical protein